MKVRMLTTAAGPAGVFLSGEVLEIEDALARAFVAAGSAVPLQVLNPVRSPSVEQAVAPKPAEAAVASPSFSPKRGKGFHQRGR